MYYHFQLASRLLTYWSQMPTRQDKVDARAKRHVANIHAHNSQLPHAKKSTAAQPGVDKSLIAKHEAKRREIDSRPNVIRLNIDKEAKCNQFDCLFEGEYTLLKEEYTIIIVICLEKRIEINALIVDKVYPGARGCDVSAIWLSKSLQHAKLQKRLKYLRSTFFVILNVWGNMHCNIWLVKATALLKTMSPWKSRNISRLQLRKLSRNVKTPLANSFQSMLRQESTLKGLSCGRDVQTG